MMDPDLALKEIRELVLTFLRKYDVIGSPTDRMKVEVADKAFELVELVYGLDRWLSKGGFLPLPWGSLTGGMLQVGREFFYKFVEENKNLYQQITAVQARNTLLVEQRRQLKEVLKRQEWHSSGYCNWCLNRSPNHKNDCVYEKVMNLT
jgi:hypothetical protein